MHVYTKVGKVCKVCKVGDSNKIIRISTNVM